VSGSLEVVLDCLTHQRSAAAMPMRIIITAIVTNRRIATLPHSLSASLAESSLDEQRRPQRDPHDDQVEYEGRASRDV
jgi:hypothetical protein